MVTSHRLPRLVLALAALAPAACETPESATSLNTEGPPMLRQVFLREPDATGRLETVLAFGSHPDVPMERTHAVTQAAPMPKQPMRVVMDELLIGNYLEEVKCHAREGTPDCPQWSRVPEGATPLDIERCATPDTLDSLCTGPMAVCLNPEGKACGIEDDPTDPVRPADGAPDDLRLIQRAVTIRCGNIEVGFDQDLSYWQPAGNQLVPAGRVPENSLGPALILTPTNSATPPQAALPTNQTDCHLVFANDVVDKDHIRVCAPANGDLANDCAPGDMAAFKFGTEALKETAHQPDGTGIALTSAIRLDLNAPVDPNELRQTVTVKADGVVVDNVVVTRVETGDRNRIDIKLPSGQSQHQMLPNTTYEVTVLPRDTYGVPAPAPMTFSFTTMGS